MLRRVTRRSVLGGLMAGASWPAWANAPRTSLFPEPRPASVRRKGAGSVDELIAAAQLGGAVAFEVIDLQSGAIVESKSPLLRLPPASVAKAVTSLYALDKLGPGFRFETRVIATGPVANGRVEGDLVLAGGGDPSLDTEALAELARQLRDAGIREIAGKFRYWGGALPYFRQIDGDQPVHLGYNPAVFGLNLNYNRVFFEWARQGADYLLTMDARSRNYRPRVATSRIALADRKSPIFDYNAGAKVERWTVARSALGRKGGRWLPVRKPGVYAAEVFHTLARSFGIALPQPVRANGSPAGTVVARVSSPPLTELLRGMLKHSTNLTAEAVGLAATQAGGSRPTTLKASARKMSEWAQARSGGRNISFVDHSGLGDGSRISVHEMNRLMAGSGWAGTLRSLLKDVPLRDAKGKPIKNHPIKVYAKTGTLNFVSNLSGFFETGKGRRYAFTIFAADMPRRNKLTRRERERPRGGRAWNKRAKVLQQQLIERWARAFG